VYKTINPISKKFYIGSHSTNNLKDNYKGSGVWVQSCKKNKEAFNKLICKKLKFFDTIKEAREYEEILIKKNINKKLNMNFKLAADGMTSEDMLGEKNSMYGKKHKLETLKIMSEQKQGKKNHLWGKKRPEVGKKISKALKGKMCWDNRGDNNPMRRPEVAEKVSKALKGRKVTWIPKGRVITWGHKISEAKKRANMLRKGKVA
jgi:hypothetical protein